MANPHEKVFDCPNIDNPNKGGVSTIFFDPTIEVEKVMDDSAPAPQLRALVLLA